MNWVFWAVIFLIALFIWILLGKIFPEIGEAVEKSKDRTIGRKEKETDHPITVSIEYLKTETFDNVNDAYLWLYKEYPFGYTNTVVIDYEHIRFSITSDDKDYILITVKKFLNNIVKGE